MTIPDKDFDDLMSGVDAVLGQGYVDASRLFVTGGSGGGVLTAWIVGHTDRFRAAVVVKPVINWTSFVLTADMSNYFYRYWFAGFPWDEEQVYWKRSPLAYVGNVHTPTMLMTGESDYRTPSGEAEQFYEALKLRRVDTALVRVPNAPHDISSRPSLLIAKVAYVLGWFAAHDVGAPHDTGKPPCTRDVGAPHDRSPLIRLRVMEIDHGLSSGGSSGSLAFAEIAMSTSSSRGAARISRDTRACQGVRQPGQPGSSRFALAIAPLQHPAPLGDACAPPCCRRATRCLSMCRPAICAATVSPCCMILDSLRQFSRRSALAGSRHARQTAERRHDLGAGDHHRLAQPARSDGK